VYLRLPLFVGTCGVAENSDQSDRVLTIAKDCFYLHTIMTIKNQGKKKQKNRELAVAIAERLNSLREVGESGVMFAKRMNAPRPQYNSWINGKRVPGGAYLRKIATALGVSADWLLGIEGAPKYSGQSRDDTELAADISAFAIRELRMLAAPVSWSALLSRAHVDGAVLLADAIRDLWNEVETAAEKSSAVPVGRYAPLEEAIARRSKLTPKQRRAGGVMAIIASSQEIARSMRRKLPHDERRFWRLLEATAVREAESISR
jgi:transcriptional regulator with XRE-family HTH domain